MKNIQIKESTNQQIEHAEGGFKWLLILFLALAWICREDVPMPAAITHHAIEMPTTSLQVLGWRLF